MTSSEFRGAWDGIVSFVLAAAKVLSAMALVLTVAYGAAVATFGLARNELLDLMRDFIGQTASEQQIGALAATVSEMSDELRRVDLPKLAVTVSRIEEIVTDNHPPAVVEVDMARSGIFGPDGEPGVCSISEVCEARYLVRRTETGRSCGVPSVATRRVLDALRNGFAAYPGDGTEAPQAVGGEFEWRSIFFQTSARTPLGFAQFVLILEYPCGGQSVSQDMPPLPFTLTGEE